MRYLAGKELRRRFVIHHGSIEIVLDELEKFGLDRTKVPIQLHGDWDVEQSSQEWIEERCRIELERY